MRFERILDAPKTKGFRDSENPARGKGRLVLPMPKRHKTNVRHHAALPDKEVSACVVRCADRQALGAPGLEFKILTAARPSETCA